MSGATEKIFGDSWDHHESRTQLAQVSTAAAVARWARRPTAPRSTVRWWRRVAAAAAHPWNDLQTRSIMLVTSTAGDWSTSRAAQTEHLKFHLAASHS